MKESKETDKRVVRIILASWLIASLLFLVSCKPEPCVDRYEFTYSDGTTEWVEVEYDCDDIYYTPYYY